MTPFEHMLKDDEIAAVLTFIRNSFGNKAGPILPEQVAKLGREKKISSVFIHQKNSFLNTQWNKILKR